ncbi:hypothetical protein [Variovorax paradoxus]|uniref:hypothetical protein n=1 Tax=Variovorax paradoxus TaxID=34073 RepID=UPI001C0A811B
MNTARQLSSIRPVSGRALVRAGFSKGFDLPSPAANLGRSYAMHSLNHAKARVDAFEGRLPPGGGCA